MKFGTLAGRVLGAGLLGSLGLAVVPEAANASPVTLYVATGGTNTGNNCRTAEAPCQTIGFALTQAPSGATIEVQAGTYPEQIQIDQPVTIVGAGATRTILEPTSVPVSDADTDTGLPQFAIVDISGTTGVNLQNLSVNGNAATASYDTDGDGCGQDPVGVYYHDASGSMTGDTVTGINLPADLFGCQGGQGIYVATDSTSALHSTVTISHDSVNNYDKNGITCDDPNTACTITHTDVSGIGSTDQIAQNGVQIWGAAGTLSNDTITANTYDGPLYAAAGVLVGDPYTLSITSNLVTSNDSNIYVLQDQQPGWTFCGSPTITTCLNPAKTGTTFTISKNRTLDGTNTYGNPVGSGYGDGIDLDSITQPTTVKSNVASNDPGNGIALYGATKVTASRNTVNSDGNGIFVGAGTASSTASNDTLSKNKASSSLIDGISVDADAASNTVKKNTLSLSGSYDAQDASTGAGTAGTADTWSGNHCTTGDPAGLCPAGHGPRAGAAAGGVRSSGLHRALVRRMSFAR